VNIKEDHIPEFIRNGQDNVVVALLYKKVFPVAEKYILRKSGRREDAADAFQEALMIFYKQVIKSTFDPKYKVFGYVFRLTINQWINKIKKDGKLHLTDELPEMPQDNAPETTEILLSKDDPGLLISLFSEIGEKCVELLGYTIYSNMLMEDIVIRMGFVSESAVKMQQHRCKKKLIEVIEKNPKLMRKLKGHE